MPLNKKEKLVIIIEKCTLRDFAGHRIGHDFLDYVRDLNIGINVDLTHKKDTTIEVNGFPSELTLRNTIELMVDDIHKHYEQHGQKVVHEFMDIKKKVVYN